MLFTDKIWAIIAVSKYKSPLTLTACLSAAMHVYSFHAMISKLWRQGFFCLISKLVHVAVLICTNSAKGQENEEDHGTDSF